MSKVSFNGRDKVIDAFNRIKFKNIRLSENFEKEYKGYKWYLIPHWRVEIVLYAVPCDEKLKEQPWESWYISEGAETHHVHYAYKIHDDDMQWIQKEWTEERPDEVIGDYWYWYDDKNMLPELIQEK